MTARHVGSGEVDVLSTPWVLALVERTTVDAIAPHLPEGLTSVGASVELVHSAPSIVGRHVRAHARAEDIDKRKVRFAFTVSDEGGEVARGTIVRVLVDRNAFERAAAKRLR
jgi:fluoroacetyl-CoA thioesterase